MSYLSTFLGANAQGYSAFKGTPNRNYSNSYIYIAPYFNSYHAVISSNASNSLTPTFRFTANDSPTFYGYTEVTGLGNACFEISNNSFLTFQYDGTLTFNTINFSPTNSGSPTFQKGGGTSLTAVYNLGIRGRFGSMTFSVFNSNASLTTITLSELSLSSSYYNDIRFTGCALSAQSVENILVAADAGSPATLSTGSNINLSGGTSSGAGALTAAAAAARTSLIAKGCTVTLNP